MFMCILSDMRPFFSVLALAATSSAFHLILGYESTLAPCLEENCPKDAYSHPIYALFSVFNMLFFVDFDLDSIEVDRIAAAERVLVRIIFCTSMVVVPIVLLNLLIALMSDSYERIQEASANEFKLMRSKILVEHEILMTDIEKANSEWFPSWLLVVVPYEKRELTTIKDIGEWQGMLHRITSTVSQSEHQVNKQVERQVNEVKGQVNEVKVQVNEVKRQVNGIKEQVDDLTKQIGSVFGRVDEDHDLLCKLVDARDAKQS